MAFDWKTGKIVGETPAQKLQRIKGLKAVEEGEEAKKFLEAPWYRQIFTQRFAREAIPEAIRTFTRMPVQLGISALQTPRALITGKPEEKPAKLPLYGEVPSFQYEAAERAKRIVGEAVGEEKVPTLLGREIPWQLRAVKPFVQVPLAALETVALAKGVTAGVKFITKTAKARATKTAIEETMPALTKKVRAEAIERAGKPSGVVKKGLRRKLVIQPSKQDMARGEAVAGLVKKRDPTGNATRINREIERVSEQVITPHLEANPAPFRMQDLKASLTKTEPKSMLTKKDVTMQNAYNAIKEGIVDELTRYFKPAEVENNTKNLWKARSRLDDVFEREVGGKAWDDVRTTAAKEAFRDLRSTINQFIGNRTPGTLYKDNLRTLSHLYDAVENIGEANYRLVGTTPWSRLLKNYPLLRIMIRAGAVAIGGYGGYRLIGEIAD